MAPASYFAVLGSFTILQPYCTITETSLAYAGGNATPEDRRFLAGKQIFHTGSTTFTKPMADRYSNNFVTVTTTGRNKDGSCVLSTLDGFYFG